MVKQKNSVQLVNEEPVVDGAAVISADAEEGVFADLAATLAEVRKLKGVLGYILRSDTSAIVDLPNENVCPYALLTSTITESTADMAKQFNLSDTETVVVEGKNVKVLCISLGVNKINVFMEKTATHAWIIKRILL